MSDRSTKNCAEREAFAARLKERMDKLEINRRALSESTGADRNRIGEWLRAEHWPNAGHLLALSRQLAVSIDWLLTGAGPLEHPAAAGQAALSLAQELAELAPSLTALAGRAERLGRAGGA